MSTDELVSRSRSDDVRRTGLVTFLEAYRSELTWQDARELYALAFPLEGPDVQGAP